MRGEVGVEDGVVEGLPAGLRAGDVGQGAYGVDLRGDLGVGGGTIWGAVAEVDLVAVVAGRVVAGGDLHAGDGAEVPYGEGEDGGGEGAGEDGRAQAGAGHDGGRVAGEVLGLVAGVVADDDEAVGVALLLQVPGEAGGGADDDGAVHAHGTGAEFAAQAGGAELEGAGEACGEFGVVLGVDELPRARRGCPRRGPRPAMPWPVRGGRRRARRSASRVWWWGVPAGACGCLRRPVRGSVGGARSAVCSLWVGAAPGVSVLGTARNRSATEVPCVDAPTAAGGHPPTRPLLAVRGYRFSPPRVAAGSRRRPAQLRAVVPPPVPERPGRYPQGGTGGRWGTSRSSEAREWGEAPRSAGPRHPPRARTRAGCRASAAPRAGFTAARAPASAANPSAWRSRGPPGGPPRG